MIPVFFPVKKLRRNGKYVLFGAILLVGAVAMYHEMVAARAWSDLSMAPYVDGSNWRTAMFDKWVRRDQQPNDREDSAAWTSSYTPQPWKPEYMGQVNLHVFEDWCGGSTDELRKNPHYPLYPHIRTTVQKLAVSPRWSNYGLRIFGYLHPYADGDFVFALSSDDNSELWLSTDESPLHLQLLAWVGKAGTEWTAPGEFEKYASQTSIPVRLSARRRYFFEVIHKQNNKGTDHVEVAWQLLDQSFRFMLIDSKHISLYVNESTLFMGDVAHIPQTAASHQHAPTSSKQPGSAADMLREDPRDSLYKVPLMDSEFLQGLLPDCSYKPSYTIKDFPLLRYQGLQFVHMSYIYPNDYTRLTNMESENSCFYTNYMRMLDLSRYMRLDHTDERGNKGFGRKSVLDEDVEFDNDAFERNRAIRSDKRDNALFPDYGDDYDDYAQKRRRKLLFILEARTKNSLNSLNSSDTRTKGDFSQPRSETPAEPQPSSYISVRHLQTNNTESKLQGLLRNKVEQVKPKKSSKRQKVRLVKMAVTPGRTREQLEVKQQPVLPVKQLKHKPHRIQRPQEIHQAQIQKMNDSKPQTLERDTRFSEKPTEVKQRNIETREGIAHKYLTTSKRDSNQNRKRLRDKEIEMNMPLQEDEGHNIHRVDRRHPVDKRWSDLRGEDNQVRREDEVHRDTWEGEADYLWGPGDDEARTPPPEIHPEVNWNQTFHVNQLDLQARRTDGIDLRCNVSGNLLLDPSDALPVVKAFMEQLNKKHKGRFTLERVINVVKRVDGFQGGRYLVELQVKDMTSGRQLRLSHYIYTLTLHSGHFRLAHRKPEQVLCNPVGFRWNPIATVHFVVPVKNQARWVQQLITDMEELFRETGDTNFNLIIVDYSSTDMDVRQALEKSSLHRFQYVKLSGNFERSAGLQAGINLIDDKHSIVFLCDLHIRFPSFIIDSIRKHCVEGHMVFAPVVIRLHCGATPSEARGYWEINGFGLLGIYKSDLDAVGGMNTREFKDRWGGEDWELLDRILQAGLEVDRIHLRNFFHHYHSKRGMWNSRMSAGHR